MLFTPKTDGIIGLLIRLWGHIRPRRRFQFVLLMCLMLLSTFAEVVSVGAVIPFLAALSNPEKVFSYPIVKNLVGFISVQSADGLLFPLCIFFVAVAVIAGLLRIFLIWVSSRLTSACGSELSVDVYVRTLHQPYSRHVLMNSSDVISGIGNVNGVVFGVVLPLLSMFSSSALLVVLMTTLILINPIAATASILCFGSSYLCIAWFARKRLLKNSRCIAFEQTRAIQIMQESLGGIRDVQLDGSQDFYGNIYREIDLPLRRAQADNNFIGLSPKFVMDTMAMILIAILTYWMSTTSGGLIDSLPILGALAIGAQRLLPAIQQSYATWTSIVGNTKQLNSVLEMLDQKIPNSLQEILPLNFCDGIEIVNLNFKYQKNGPWVIRDMNLKIPKGCRVGIVGSTGSGKSTLIDLIMGLLFPTSGKIFVDGIELNGKYLSSWQRNIAHVPQNIFLTDSSFYENIAFGIPPNLIDIHKIKQAAEQADIANLIEDTEDGYNTQVGERGIRLSGGQRQRIAIARALYKQASVLVLDEATSALDTSTEVDVMSAINAIDRKFTVLMIAHRTTTLRGCDMIVEIRNGRLVKIYSGKEAVQFIEKT